MSLWTAKPRIWRNHPKWSEMQSTSDAKLHDCSRSTWLVPAHGSVRADSSKGTVFPKNFFASKSNIQSLVTVAANASNQGDLAGHCQHDFDPAGFVDVVALCCLNNLTMLLCWWVTFRVYLMQSVHWAICALGKHYDFLKLRLDLKRKYGPQRKSS